MISKEDKSKIIKDFGQGERDTGSTEVQVAILTSRINELTEHFKIHKKDYHGQRGLLKMVGARRSLLKYIRRTNSDGYLALIKKLKLRH